MTEKPKIPLSMKPRTAVKIDVRLEDETVCPTQQLMAELFQTTERNIG